ncbi:helix-turn-helix transcriptional regulator [Streptosporangium sp. NPDC048047]|uniref:helix-turn-helix domain-containing protein n=1 Tax=Streptosporangium sp. NPDC048047 TaxID=3155748 RepID=UPI003417F1AA
MERGDSPEAGWLPLRVYLDTPRNGLKRRSVVVFLLPRAEGERAERGDVIRRGPLVAESPPLEVDRLPGGVRELGPLAVQATVRSVVRRRREELGLTQAELAGRAGLKQPVVACFEAGGTMPTLPMLERLAEALEMRLSVRFQPLREAS